ncbi:splicing factor 3B subunit 2 [Willisornis vidua]|uniref:Splicing factor 3B subunit 2 n=1 Tax=Willisornis vidua TaxID=1566151 RepID=A0ABQ9DV65_9PASS|nr:splicing factor 3B subunit 2 [Willisornis vidua]
MGSTHIYDMSAVMGRKGPVAEAQGVEVALAPEELELDPTAMTQKYEEHVREQQAQVEKEDFSDMVAEHAAKQKVGLAPADTWVAPGSPWQCLSPPPDPPLSSLSNPRVSCGGGKKHEGFVL